MTPTQRNLELLRARKLLEREKAKEYSLRTALENRTVDPKPAQGQNRSVKKSQHTAPLNHTSPQARDPNQAASSPIPMVDHSFSADQLGDHSHHMNMSDVPALNPAHSSVQKMDAPRVSTGNASHNQKGNGKVIVVKSDSELMKEAMLQRDLTRQKKLDALHALENELKRKEDEVRQAKQRQQEEEELRLKAAKEVEEMLTQREKNRLEARMKLIQKQDHHVSSFQKIVEDTELKIKMEQEKVQTEQEKAEQRLKEREDRDKHRKFEGASVTKQIQLEQMEEKKRVRQMEKERLAQELAKTKQAASDAEKREMEAARARMERNLAYQADLINQIKSSSKRLSADTSFE